MIITNVQSATIDDSIFYRLRLLGLGLGLLLSSAGYAWAAEQFSIVLLPDTQYYSNDASRIQHFHNQTQWIVDNRAERNIVFVSHLGDIVDSGGNITQWVRADAAMDRLDAGVPDLPYSAVLGNHDTDPIYDANGSADLYVNYFGAARYAGRSWYGGASPDQRNHYQTFSAGGRDFLHLSLEYQAASTTNANYAEIVAWAQGVIDAHPDWPTMISTHTYLLSDATRSSHGTNIYNALVNNNPQVFLVANGHTHSEAHRTVLNATGDEVFEMLTDYQSYPNGGDGWLRILTFDEDAGEILATTYSPSLDQYETDANSQFVLPLNFSERFDGQTDGGVVIASQNFEGNSLSRGIPRDDIAAGLGWYDANGYSIPGLYHDSGVGLGWTSSTDATFPIGTAPVASSDNGDVMGVMIDNNKDFGTTNGLADAPGQTGNFYIVEDADSTWTVTFDPVDTSGYKDLELSFTWAIDNDGGGSTAGSNFEVDDYIEVVVNGITVFHRDGAGDYLLGNATGGLDDLDAPYINAFTLESIDISTFDGQILNISFIITNNAAPEDIAFDNVTVTGTLIGDLDGDGFVGIADLNIVLGNWNQNVTPGSSLDGDPSGDGFVGIEDLNEVLGNWNAGAPPTTVVPEPSMVVILTGVCLWMTRVRY